MRIKNFCEYEKITPSVYIVTETDGEVGETRAEFTEETEAVEYAKRYAEENPIPKTYASHYLEVTKWTWDEENELYDILNENMDPLASFECKRY